MPTPPELELLAKLLRSDTEGEAEPTLGWSCPSRENALAPIAKPGCKKATAAVILQSRNLGSARYYSMEKTVFSVVSGMASASTCRRLQATEEETSGKRSKRPPPRRNSYGKSFQKEGKSTPKELAIRCEEARQKKKSKPTCKPFFS
jgi:hypothetical protein